MSAEEPDKWGQFSLSLHFSKQMSQGASTGQIECSSSFCTCTAFSIGFRVLTLFFTRICIASFSSSLLPIWLPNISNGPQFLEEGILFHLVMFRPSILSILMLRFKYLSRTLTSLTTVTLEVGSP